MEDKKGSHHEYGSRPREHALGGDEDCGIRITTEPITTDGSQVIISLTGDRFTDDTVTNIEVEVRGDGCRSIFTCHWDHGTLVCMK
jgi:hypothetical protein